MKRVDLQLILVLNRQMFYFLNNKGSKLLSLVVEDLLGAHKAAESGNFHL